MPIIGLLGLMLIAFKITGYITASWWLVLIPFWGSAAVAALLAALAAGSIGVSKALLRSARR